VAAGISRRISAGEGLASIVSDIFGDEIPDDEAFGDDISGDETFGVAVAIGVAIVIGCASVFFSSFPIREDWFPVFREAGISVAFDEVFDATASGVDCTVVFFLMRDASFPDFREEFVSVVPGEAVDAAVFPSFAASNVRVESAFMFRVI